MPCNHQEADSRVFLHVYHAARQRHFHPHSRQRYYVYCRWPLWQPWFYGVKDRFWNWKNLPAHPLPEITQAFGLEKSLSLPLFHSFIRCDSTPSFLGTGKKSAWAAWQTYPYLTETQFSLFSICIWHALNVGLYMFNNISGCPRVNDARRQFFTHVLGRSITPATTYSNMQDEL